MAGEPGEELLKTFCLATLTEDYDGGENLPQGMEQMLVPIGTSI